MISAIRRRVVRLRTRDRGISVVELIIYMGLGAMVLSLAATMYVNVAKTTKSSSDRRASTAEAQNILTLATADIRSATNVPVSSTITTWAVLAATPSSVTFITYTDAGPSFGQPYQVSLAVDGSGRMILSQWNPPAVGTTTFPRTDPPTSTRIVGSGVTNSSVFSYLDSAGNTISASPSMASANYPSVAAISISLALTAPGSSVPVTMTNTVWMPNAGLSAAYAGAN